MPPRYSHASSSPSSTRIAFRLPPSCKAGIWPRLILCCLPRASSSRKRSPLQVRHQDRVHRRSPPPLAQGPTLHFEPSVTIPDRLLLASVGEFPRLSGERDDGRRRPPLTCSGSAGGSPRRKGGRNVRARERARRDRGRRGRGP